MSMRREARQLVAGDQFQMNLLVQLEMTGDATQSEDALTFEVRIVPCGPECGRGCDCHGAVFGESTGPYTIRLNGSQRLRYFGNLTQLLADAGRIQSQISRLQGANGASPNGAADLSTNPEPR